MRLGTGESLAYPRVLALLVGAAITAPCLTVLLTALGAPLVAANLVSAILVLTGAWLVHTKAPESVARVDKSAIWLFALWLLVSVAAVYRVSSLAVFIIDVSRTEHAFQRQARTIDDPELTKPFFVKHNCSTCYLVAAHLAGSGVENLYDRKYYRDAKEPTPVHEEIGEAFKVDQYQYPPPFLLGPYLLMSTGLDFFEIRALWFAFSVLLFVLTSGAITVWIAGWRFTPLWLIWPTMLVAPSVIATLQMGNTHVFIVLIAVLAMLCFEKRWNAAGGALLAYATLSKFFPGLLVIYLLVRRRWSSVAWTAAAGVVLCLATLVAFGPQPWEAFLGHQLPALANGDAFWFAFEKSRPMLNNGSIMGLPIKLDRIGVPLPGEPRVVAQALVWVYTLALLVIVVFTARRDQAIDVGEAENRQLLARTWVALVVLAQLRSPFLPMTYGNSAILLLLALLLPLDRVRPALLGLTALGVVAYALVLPLPIGPASSAFDHGFGVVATLVAVGLAIAVASTSPGGPSSLTIGGAGGGSRTHTAPGR